MRRTAILLVLIGIVSMETGAQSQIPTILLGQATTIDIRPNPIPPPSCSCDANKVLLEVLENIVDKKSITNELEYEKANKLDANAIYERRMSLIKTLVGKK